MNKPELAERLAMPLGMSRFLARSVVNGVTGMIGEARTRCDEVRVVGYGCFSARNRPMRTGGNPGAGETVENEPTKGWEFNPGSLIEDAANARHILNMGGGEGGTSKACDDMYVEAARWR